MFNFDLEAKLYIYLANLLVLDEKKYSACECERNIVYIFHDYNEFKFYFLQNGVHNCDEEINNCIMHQTKKGSIIAPKKYCDDEVRKIINAVLDKVIKE